MIAFIPLINVFLAGFCIHRILHPASPGALNHLKALPAIFGLGSASHFLFFLWVSWLGDVTLAARQIPVIASGTCWWLLRYKNSLCNADSPDQRFDRTDCALLIGITLYIAINSALTIYLPILDWDTRILWALKAKILTMEPTLTGEAFRDPYRLHIHPRYPLLVPFLASWTVRLQGEFIEPLYQLLISVFAFLTLWQFYLLLTRLGRKSSAIMLTAVLACTGTWLTAQYNSGVEVALTFFLVLALNSLLAWETEQQIPDLLMAGIFLFGAGMVKNEGLLLVLCCFVALFATLLTSGGFRPAARTSALLAGVFLLLSSGWLLYLLSIPPVSDEQYLSRLTPEILGAGLQRFDIIMGTIASRMIDLRQWHLLWLTPLLTGAVLITKRAAGTTDCSSYPSLPPVTAQGSCWSTSSLRGGIVPCIST